MNKKHRLLFILIFNFYFCMISTEYLRASIETRTEHPHRIYEGFNLSGLTLDIPLSPCHYKGSQFAGGLNLGYEYRKPHRLYFGIQIHSLRANSGFKFLYENEELEDENHYPFVAQLKLEIGYNTVYRNWLLTPYVALGKTSIDFPRQPHYGFQERFNYLGFGIKGEYGKSENCDLGFDFQLFKAVSGHKGFIDYYFYIARKFDSFGIYAGLPINVRFGESKKWDMQVEPYILSLSLNEKQLTYGTRFILGRNI